VTTGNCRRSYIALDRRLNWLVTPQKWNEAKKIREMLAAHTPYTKVEPLWARLRTEMEEDLKARQDKLDADNATIDADQGKRRADMKAFNEMMERREAVVAVREQPTQRKRVNNLQEDVESTAPGKERKVIHH
jgi:Skp family chaperone for outer membrane proteins